MQSSLKGRITEIWTDRDQTYAEFLIGPNRFVFKAFNLLAKFNRGDLASISTNSAEEITQITKLGGPNPDPQAWNPVSDTMRWRRATGEPSRMVRLYQRQLVLMAIREDLYSQEFLEVETPLQVKGTCPDTHIESISIENTYLVTSTEYQIKRMIVGGFENLFTLTKNFRANDRGRYHSSEFTMLEWARAYGSLDDIETDAIRFIRKAFQKLYPGKASLSYENNEINFTGKPWEKLTVREAFKKYLGLEDLGDFSLEPLCEASRISGIQLPPHFQHDKHLILSYLLDLLQPNLGTSTPTFLREWPLFMTSSAQVCHHDPYVAERSELYIGGIEIADGFPFLTDSQLQKSHFARELERRQTEGRQVVSVDEKYVEALAQGIPPGAGMALGIDRLVMVLTGALKLADVQAFGWDEI
jgi:lysyl-tRNA synthetase class 2